MPPQLKLCRKFHKKNWTMGKFKKKNRGNCFWEGKEFKWKKREIKKRCKRHKLPKINLCNQLHLNRTKGKCWQKTCGMNLGEEGKCREKNANVTNGIPKWIHEFIQIGQWESVQKEDRGRIWERGRISRRQKKKAHVTGQVSWRRQVAPMEHRKDECSRPLYRSTVAYYIIFVRNNISVLARPQNRDWAEGTPQTEFHRNIKFFSIEYRISFPTSVPTRIPPAHASLYSTTQYPNCTEQHISACKK